MITLKQYAERLGKEPSGLRRKAEQGGFETARKIGRDWFIDENEPYIDRRVKTMKKTFIEKVRNYGTYDTEKYRYKITDEGTIKRITLDALDTTAALNDKSPSNPYGWEIMQGFYPSKWWNGGQEIVTISGARYALNGWNGETWGHCWKVLGKYGIGASRAMYEIKPIYGEQDDDENVEIIGYEIV